MSIKRIARIAIFAALLLVQELALSFIPSVQLTQCLLVVYYYAFGLLDSIIIIAIHVLLDNLIMGSLDIVFTPIMFASWILLPLSLHLFKKHQNKYFVSFIVALHAIIYSLIFVIVSVIIYEIPFITYFITDLPFEIIFLVNGFITTLIFKDKLINLLNKFNEKLIH